LTYNSGAWEVQYQGTDQFDNSGHQVHMLNAVSSGEMASSLHGGSQKSKKAKSAKHAF
jgi:hypothetical protein